MIDEDRSSDFHPPFWKTRFAAGWLVLGGVAAYFLLTQHLAHVMGALPYLLFLACPLMHLFMHHGHHRHHHDHGTERGTRQQPGNAGGDHESR